MNNTAYVVDGNLQIIDISNPLYPQHVGSVDTPGDACAVEVVGQNAYVLDGESGDIGFWEKSRIQIIDVSDSSSPKIVTSVETPHSAIQGFSVMDHILYIADYYDAFLVTDVSDPFSPKVIGSVNTNEGCYTMGLEVVDHIAYVYNDCGDSYSIDVTDPYNPKLIETGYWPDVSLIVGETGYGIDPNKNIEVFGMSRPSSPRIIGSVETPGEVQDIAVMNQIAYVADGKAGLTIVSVSEVKELTDFVLQGTETISLTLPSPSMAGDYTLRVFNDAQDSSLIAGVYFADISPPVVINLQDDFYPVCIQNLGLADQ